MAKKMICALVLSGWIGLLCGQALSEEAAEGALMLGRFGYSKVNTYSGCVQLSNATTRVVLDPLHGGQVLEYSLNQENALFINSEYTSVFDIGPEMGTPPHPTLFYGRWRAEIIGPRAARLTSAEDPSSGLQLMREFKLDEHSSRLSCTQTMKNISDGTREYCHWGRTLAAGHGVCLVPLASKSRFPQGFITYDPGPVANFAHEDHPNVKVRDRFLEISGPPPRSKFGIDSDAGWFAYITRNNLLYVMQFPVFPERVYGELEPYTVSIYYWEKAFCELEPIGPMERLEPGESASFTEVWWLFPYDFPREGHQVDIGELQDFVQTNTR